MLNYSSYHYNIPASINNVSLAGYSYSGVVAIMPATIIAKNVNPPAVLREDAIQTILFGKQYDTLNLSEAVNIFNGLKIGAHQPPLILKQGGYMICRTHDTILAYSCSFLFQQIYFNGNPSKDHSFTQNAVGTVTIVADFFHKQVK